MSIFLKTLDRCGQPVFIVLAFMTLPFWFPLLLAWVIIDPPYRWASWQKRGIKSHMKSVGPTPAPAINGEPVVAETSHSQEKGGASTIPMGRIG
jgi:hypothetical protein